MLCIMSMVRPLRPWAISMTCEILSTSWAKVLLVFSWPVCNERTSPSRSSCFCCICLSRTLVIRKSPAVLAKSVLVTSWSAPKRSFSRCATPKSFCSFSTFWSVLAMVLRKAVSSSRCCSKQTLCSSILPSVSLTRLASCWTCAWTSRTCSATGCMIEYIWLRMKACMLPWSSSNPDMAGTRNNLFATGGKAALGSFAESPDGAKTA
mmetsp:Transcript_87044/g.274879  ORF Transcript_87044/g.274879 Transcript_87044/m.274879 type:complete len:207 (+) Transcript_87044:429-1049(+)